MDLKNSIEALKLKRLSYTQIAAELGCSKSAVAYYLNGFGNAHVRQRMAKCRSKNRKKLITTLKLEAGGKCRKCGYDRCLDALGFHHVDPTKKGANVSLLVRVKSIEDTRAETKKCWLLCANCHAELHAGLWS